MTTNRLAALALPDPDGAVHRLADLWADRPVIVVFLRHFGCLHCRQFASGLRDAYPTIREAGAEVVAVGTGNAAYARDFVNTMNIPFLVLIDDDGAAARAASVRTLRPWAMLSPRLWRNASRTRQSGFRQSKTGRRPMQLGAQFVIGRGGDVRFEHRERTPSDHATITELLDAVRARQRAREQPCTPR